MPEHGVRVPSLAPSLYVTTCQFEIVIDNLILHLTLNVKCNIKLTLSLSDAATVLFYVATTTLVHLSIVTLETAILVT